MTYFVQIKTEDGEVLNTLMSEGEIIKVANEMDFNGCADICVYVISKFGTLEKLAYKGWQPNCLIQFVDTNGNVVIEGYGEDH